MAHVPLEQSHILMVLGLVTCEGVAQHILNPSTLKARLIANLAPSLLPVTRANRAATERFFVLDASS